VKNFVEVRVDFRSSKYILSQAKIAQEIECSQVYFRSREKIFAPARKYFSSSVVILTQAKIKLELECHRDLFRLSESVLAEAKKIVFFFYCLILS